MGDGGWPSSCARTRKEARAHSKVPPTLRRPAARRLHRLLFLRRERALIDATPAARGHKRRRRELKSRLRARAGSGGGGDGDGDEVRGVGRRVEVRMNGMAENMRCVAVAAAAASALTADTQLVRKRISQVSRATSSLGNRRRASVDERSRRHKTSSGGQ